MYRLVAVCWIVLMTPGDSSSLYLWNVRHRVPVPLAEALARAKRALGDDAANRYCVRVRLFGNAAGDGKEGAWNFGFAAKDGSQIAVSVPMIGEPRVRPGHKAIDWKKRQGRRSDLNDAIRQVKLVLRKRKVPARFAREGATTTVTFRTRTYQVHQNLADGSYSPDLTGEVGPKADGFLLLASECADYPRTWVWGGFQRPYWTSDRRVYMTHEKDRFIKVEVLYGSDADFDLLREIGDAFGEEARDSL